MVFWLLVAGTIPPLPAAKAGKVLVLRLESPHGLDWIFLLPANATTSGPPRSRPPRSSSPCHRGSRRSKPGQSCLPVRRGVPTLAPADSVPSWPTPNFVACCARYQVSGRPRGPSPLRLGPVPAMPNAAVILPCRFHPATIPG